MPRYFSAPSSLWLLQDMLRDLLPPFIERDLAAREGADAATGRAAELVALAEVGVVEVVVPDNDEGSGGNSSVGQQVPTGGGRQVAMGEESYTARPCRNRARHGLCRVERQTFQRVTRPGRVETEHDTAYAVSEDGHYRELHGQAVSPSKETRRMPCRGAPQQKVTRLGRVT
ncbi:hypothetical protein ACLOJK_036395 [Asimina triloba]